MRCPSGDTRSINPTSYRVRLHMAGGCRGSERRGAAAAFVPGLAWGFI